MLDIDDIKINKVQSYSQRGVCGWPETGKQASLCNSRSVHKEPWSPERGGTDFTWAKSGGHDSELSFKDELEFSRLAQGGEGISGMCRGLRKHVVFEEPKVGQYD